MVCIRQDNPASRCADLFRERGNMQNLLFENVFVFQDADGAWHLSYEYGISRRILPLDEIHAAQQSVQPTVLNVCQKCGNRINGLCECESPVQISHSG